MKMLKKLLSCTLALALCSSCFTAIQAEEPVQDEVLAENVALNKKVLAASGNPARAVDGDINTYWDGGVAPSELFLDLDGYYDVARIVVIPYFGGSRYYHYEVYVSADGTTYEKVGEKATDETQTVKGEEYVFDTKTIKYVKVKMTYNSSNPSVHINELQVYGIENPDYEVPDKPTIDPNDPDNLAFGKPTRSTTNQAFSQLCVDGNLSTSWSGEDFPKYVDVDLLKNYDISKIHVYMPQGTQFAYTVYGSLDGVHFTTIAKSEVKESAVDGDVYEFPTSLNYRVIRVNVTANMTRQGSNSMISEIKIYGEENDTQVIPTRDKIEVAPYEDWLQESYGVTVQKDADGHYDMKDTFTQDDVQQEVRGVISRILGDAYQDWFSFELADNPKQNGKDFYELSFIDNKVHIKGNEGLSLTTGLNYYLKYYCNVHVSQQTSQVHMPDAIPVIKEAVFKESPYEIRYAYNYCTLSYTMPFWGYDEWQREMDYFALNGVNTILDTTATEALWITYLQNYGYDADEAKAFVCGYSYKAWWLMGNLESYGGPVSDEWIQDTVQMARINQRKMSILGMKPCLQGFMGAMPENFAEIANDTLMNDYHYEDIHAYMVEQGDWSGFTRPPILKTTYDGYDEMAAAFYEAQEAIYGQVTNYYAGDLAHEGGVIPPDLSKPEMSAHILDQMMTYDADAVWIIQSWLSNPNAEILQGFGEHKEDHVLVLDLDATENPHWSNTTNWNGKEFGGTSWVFCMLDNYGGRTGMHGELEYLATQISKANQESTHMKGIGISPEGTLLNPVNYDLLWEMGWESDAKDTQAWLKDYITRRYGSFTENSWKAWQLLLDSAYGYNNADGTAKYHTGNNNCITNMMPSFDPQIVIGSYEIPYDAAKVEQAMDFLLKDFDALKGNECYIYDVVDILRQVVSNTQVPYFNRITEAYDAGNYEIFTKYKTKLLDSILLLDEIAAYQEDSLMGTWVAKAKNFYQDERNSAADYDDYAKDMMIINAKAIVSSWSSKTLQTYAHRQYHGLEKDYNYPMWKLWLDALDEGMQTGTLHEPSQYTDYFAIGWNLVISDNDYTQDSVTAPDGDETHRSLADIYQLIHEQYLSFQAEKDKIIDENVAPKGTAYAANNLGSYVASRLNDNKNDTLWIASSSKVPVYAGVSLQQQYDIYKIQLVFEQRPTIGANVMEFYLEAKQSDGSWKKFYTGKSFDEATQSYTITIDCEEQIHSDDIRITYTSNGGIYPALAEMKLYSSQGMQIIDGTSMFIKDGKLNGVKEGSTVADVMDNLYIGSGTLVFEHDGQTLQSSDVVKDGTMIKQVNNGIVIDELMVYLDSHLKDDLKAAIKQALSLQEKAYSQVSFTYFQTKLELAKQQLEIPDGDAAAYRKALDELQAAIENLVDIRPLQTMLRAYENKQPEDYQADAYAIYQDYYAQAAAIFANKQASKEQLYTAQGYAELAGNYLIREENSNIAGLGTPYADSELSAYYGKAKLNNGVFDDCWVAASLSTYPVSAGITLDQERAIRKIKVAFEQNAYRNTQLGFYISVKQDGEWKKVYTGSTGSKQGYTFLVDMEGQRIEDVKVTITSYSTDAGSPYPGIAEIEIYEQNDVSTLQAIFKEAVHAIQQGYDVDTTTKDSWLPFDAAYQQAERILQDDTYAQSAIDSSGEQLKAAVDNLSWKASTSLINSLKQAIQSLHDMEHLYTEVEFADAQTAIEEAQKLLEKNEDNLGREEISNAIWQLAEVKEGLKHNVLLDALQILLHQATQIMQSDEIENTRPAKVSALQEAMEAAQHLIDTSTSEETHILRAQNNLYKAIQELYQIVDKELLHSLIAAVFTLTEGNYSEVSWNALQEAVAVAKVVADNDDATTMEVQDAYTAVSNAIAQLAMKADKRALAEQLNIAAQMLTKMEAYIPSTVNDLQAAVELAQKVYDDQTADAKDIKAACNQLIEVMAKARLKADKHGLEAVLQEARAMNMALYTSPTQTALKNVLAEADKVMKNEEATPEEVKAAVQKVEKAIAALKKVDMEQKEQKMEAVNNAATGDETHQAVFMNTLLLGGVMILILARKMSKHV